MARETAHGTRMLLGTTADAAASSAISGFGVTDEPGSGAFTGLAVAFDALGAIDLFARAIGGEQHASSGRQPKGGNGDAAVQER